MLKQAYENGVKTAMEKFAFNTADIGRSLQHGGGALFNLLKQNPHLAGALIGGGVGAATADEGQGLSGALQGAGIGAGLGGLSRLDLSGVGQGLQDAKGFMGAAFRR